MTVHTGGRLSVSCERLVQNCAVPHFQNVDHPPTGKLAAAASPYLIAEQPDRPVLNAVIVWLCDPLLILVSKMEQVFRLNGFAKDAIQRLLHRHRFWHPVARARIFSFRTIEYGHGGLVLDVDVIGQG